METPAKKQISFPRHTQGRIVVGYVLEARRAEACPDPPATLAVGEGDSRQELDRVISNKEDGAARMAVYRAAGRIAHNDVQGQKDLKNAPLRGQPHKYAQELETPVRPVLEFLTALPSTLVALVQSTTNNIRRDHASRGWREWIGLGMGGGSGRSVAAEHDATGRGRG